MIEFNTGSCRIRLDFSFFAVLSLFFLLDDSGMAFAALAVCAAHELGHLAVMRALNVRVESITLYGAGICIGSPDTERKSVWVQAAVYSAGCAVNALAGAVLLCAGQPLAAAVSLCTGALNLLPLGSLDGARLLRLWAVNSLEPHRVDRVTGAAQGAALLALAVLPAVFGRRVGFTLATTAVYLLALSIIGE